MFVAGGIPGYASARQVLVIASSIGEVGNMVEDSCRCSVAAKSSMAL